MSKINYQIDDKDPFCAITALENSDIKLDDEQVRILHEAIIKSEDSSLLLRGMMTLKAPTEDYVKALTKETINVVDAYNYYYELYYLYITSRASGLCRYGILKALAFHGGYNYLFIEPLLSDYNLVELIKIIRKTGNYLYAAKLVHKYPELSGQVYDAIYQSTIEQRTIPSYNDFMLLLAFLNGEERKNTLLNLYVENLNSMPFDQLKYKNKTLLSTVYPKIIKPDNNSDIKPHWAYLCGDDYFRMSCIGDEIPFEMESMTPEFIKSIVFYKPSSIQEVLNYMNKNTSKYGHILAIYEGIWRQIIKNDGLSFDTICFLKVQDAIYNRYVSFNYTKKQVVADINHDMDCDIKKEGHLNNDLIQEFLKVNEEDRKAIIMQMILMSDYRSGYFILKEYPDLIDSTAFVSSIHSLILSSHNPLYIYNGMSLKDANIALYCASLASPIFSKSRCIGKLLYSCYLNYYQCPGFSKTKVLSALLRTKQYQYLLSEITINTSRPYEFISLLSESNDYEYAKRLLRIFPSDYLAILDEIKYFRKKDNNEIIEIINACPISQIAKETLIKTVVDTITLQEEQGQAMVVKPEKNTEKED